MSVWKSSKRALLPENKINSYNIQKEGCGSSGLIDIVHEAFESLTGGLGTGTEAATRLAERRHREIMGGRGGRGVVRIVQQIRYARFQHRLYP